MPPVAFWEVPLAELLSALRVGSAGLGTAEVEARRTVFGPNLLRLRRERALVVEFLLRNRRVLILLAFLAVMTDLR